MTEELKQKAEAEADKVIIGSGMDRASVIHLKHLLVTMYMQGATEATKELQEENEELRKNGVCVLCSKLAKLEREKKELEKEIVELPDKWCRNKDDYCPHLAKLEKENAELKAKVTALENANRAMVKELDDMASNGLNILENVVTNKDQLTKAKTYLKYFIEILKRLGANKEPLVVEAEQFLNSEVEK